MRKTVLACLFLVSCRPTLPPDLDSRGYAVTTLVAYSVPYAMQSCLSYAHDLDQRDRAGEAAEARTHCDIDADLAGKSIVAAFARWEQGRPFQGQTACHVAESMNSVLEMPHQESADKVVTSAAEQAMFARRWCSWSGQ